MVATPYQIVSPFIDDAELKVIRGFCQGVADGRPLPSKVMPYFETTEAGSRLVRIERFVSEMVTDTGVDLLTRCERLAENFFCEPVVLFKDKINFRYPNSPGFPAHQDSAAGWEQYASIFVSIIVTLERSAPETGGFEFPQQVTPRKLLPNVNGRLSNELFDSMDPSSLCLPAGSALIFDSYAPHRTRENRSGQLIPHILLTFNRTREGSQSEKYYANKAAVLKSRGAGFAFRLFDFGPDKRGEPNESPRRATEN